MLTRNTSGCFLAAWICLVIVQAPVGVLSATATSTSDKQNAAGASFVLKLAPFRVGAIEHLQWDDDDEDDNDTTTTTKPIAPYAARIRIPWTVTDSIRSYCQWGGIFDLFQQLFEEQEQNELEPGTNHTVQLEDGTIWFLQRHLEDEKDNEKSAPPKSNRHWLSASDEASRASLLSILAKSGFDEVLDALGSFFGLEGLDMYSVGLVGMTHSDGTGAVTADCSETGGKVFHMLIPLHIKQGSRPEVFVEATPNCAAAAATADAATAKVPYEYGVALVLGDDTKHTPGIFDYRDSTGAMNIALSIYLADTNEQNVDAIIKCGGHDKKPLPPVAKEYLLQHRGRHWKKDGSVRLANVYQQQECSITEGGQQTCEDDDWDYLDWTKWGFFDFENYLRCDHFYTIKRPVPDLALWKKLRAMYVSFVGEDKSTLSLPLSSDEDGFLVKVKPDHSPGKGRGIFADQFIPKGTLVYSSRQQARFSDGYSYKKFLMSVPLETACDLLAWMTVQDLAQEGIPEVVVELDKGSLVNGGIRADDPYFEENSLTEEEMEEIANIGCIPKAAESLRGGCKLNDFALRDIQVGEELLIDYHEYSIVESDKWKSLGLGEPG